MIIIFHGINDVFPRRVPEDCYRATSPYRGLPPNASRYVRGGYDYGPSVLYRFIGINLGWMPDPTGPVSGISAQFERVACPEDDPDPMQAIRNNPPVYFERNMRTMVAIARAHDVDVMLSSWTYFQLRDWEAFAVDQHNAITAQLADELDLPFYDLRADFPRDEALWGVDLQHMNEAGNRVQAELYAAFIDEQGLIPSGGTP